MFINLIQVIPEWSSGFPYFLQVKSEFGNKEFMPWATVSSQSCFHWLYRASPSLAAKNTINLILVLAIWWCPCVESSLVLLEEGVCYDQCILLAKLYQPLPCFILYSKTKFVLELEEGVRRSCFRIMNSSVTLVRLSKFSRLLSHSEWKFVLHYFSESYNFK